jgi:hypothetical protein
MKRDLQVLEEKPMKEFVNFGGEMKRGRGKGKKIQKQSSFGILLAAATEKEQNKKTRHSIR